MSDQSKALPSAAASLLVASLLKCTSKYTLSFQSSFIAKETFITSNLCEMHWLTCCYKAGQGATIIVQLRMEEASAFSHYP